MFTYSSIVIHKRAIYKIENDDYSGETWSFAGVDVDIVIIPDGVNTYRVNSSANYGSLDRNKTINAVIRKDAQAQLIEWQVVN